MDSSVQLTNDFSIVSKYSMVNQGYFRDDFIQFFANKLVRRAPIINLGYFVRAKIIDNLLQHFTSSESQLQVLSLGAGYDTSYFRLNKENILKYVEIDLNDVVSNKINIIRSTPVLLEQLSSLKCLDCGITSEKYAVISQNLNDLRELERKLTMIGFKFELPVLVLSECSITYMEEIKSTQLIEWVARKCLDCVFINYEQIHPNDGFGRVMTNHFISVGNPIRSVVRYATVDEQRARYLEAGFNECISVSAMDFIEKSFSSQFTRSLSLEPFDEWEELHAKCCHYASTVATNGVTFKFPPYMMQRDLSALSPVPSSGVVVTFELDTRIRRFGHTSVGVGQDTIVLGGFGLLGGSDRHGRVGQIESIWNNSLDIVLEGDPGNCDCLYSKCVAINEWTFAYYGGRTSPKREVNAIAKVAHCRFVGTSLVINFQNVEASEMPPRYRHSLSFLDGCLVIYGGRNSKLDVFGDLWVYNLEARKWFGWSKDEVSSDLKGPRPRFSHSGAVSSARSEIIVSGGLNEKFKPTNDLYILKLRKKEKGHVSVEWTRMNCVPLITPRYGHTSHVSDNSLFLVGGSNANCAELPELCVIDLVNMSSVEYKIQICLERPILLHGHTSELTKPNEIVIYGGGGNCFSFGTFYNANPIRIQLPRS